MSTPPPATKEPIAILGVAGRFPGATDLESLWTLLIERGDAIRPVPAERWDASAPFDPEMPIQAVGGFIDGVEDFDAAFFGISPREAADIDPQQRLVLEQAWRSLENAGITPAHLRGTRTGVYVGASWHDYEILRKERGAGSSQHSTVGNALDVIAARVSYTFGLTGPSLTVETGCSSALVALHLAVSAIRSGEVDGAIVAGVNLILAPDVSIGLTHFGGLSPDGRCAAFAAGANGFVRGEGVVALYLRPLSAALDAGQPVRAVIVETVVNNDGGGESLVTPSPAGQEDLLRRAYLDSAIGTDRLAYVEAHGTGTGRGDPIEVTAIGRTLGLGRDPSLGPLPIGSVKTNIGHLEAAAGIAGLVKGLLALEHGTVPPSLHSGELNPEIAFAALNVSVVREPLTLPDDDDVLVGINSFGWGGTNAHVVLGRTPRTTGGKDAGPAPVIGFLPISAHTGSALRRRLGDAAALLESGAPADDVARQLADTDQGLPIRIGVLSLSGPPSDLADRLRRLSADPSDDFADAEEVVSARATPVGKVAFVFPGQGSQWQGMGVAFYGTDEVFTRTVDACAAAIAPYLEWDLVAAVAGRAGPGWMDRVDRVQPVLWAMSLGLTAMWRAAGVEPDVVLGHSQGEITAAAVAGLLSIGDSALVMGRRSGIIRDAAGPGAMLAVDLSLVEATEAIEGFEDLVSVAVNNGPSSCVLSGDIDAIDLLKEILESQGTFCRLVNVDYASHSPQMEQCAEQLQKALADVVPQPGSIRMASTVTQADLADGEVTADYWVANLRRPVMFADTMTRLFDEGVTHVIEISPHPILSHAINQLIADRLQPPVVIGSLYREADPVAEFARNRAKPLWPAWPPAVPRPVAARPACSRDTRSSRPGTGCPTPVGPAAFAPPDGPGWRCFSPPVRRR